MKYLLLTAVLLVAAPGFVVAEEKVMRNTNPSPTEKPEHMMQNTNPSPEQVPEHVMRNTNPNTSTSSGGGSPEAVDLQHLPKEK